MIDVRRARSSDLDEITRVERAANALYAPYGLAQHLEDLATPRAEVERGLVEGLAWVAEDAVLAPETLVGFALATIVGTDLHLDEIDVVPARSRRGLGSRLLDVVMDEGRARGATRITLLTVDFVPWTLGFYAHHGFRVLRCDELDARLAHQLSIDPRAHRPETRSFGGRIVLARNLQAGGASVR